MKPSVILYIASILIGSTAIAQNVGVGTTTPHSKAILEVKVPNPTSNPQGMLLPRLTTSERTSLTAALDESAKGLLVYDTGSNTTFIWNGTSWEGGEDPETGWVVSNDTLYNTNIGPVLIGTNINAGWFNIGTNIALTGDGGASDKYTLFQTAIQSENINYILPAAQATASNSALINDGTGALSWESVAPISSSTANQPVFFTSDGKKLTTSTVLNTDVSIGKVGINRAPSNGYQLQVEDKEGAQSAIQLTAKNSTGNASNDGLILSVNNVSANILSYEATSLNIGTSGANRITITKDGDVGIGTNSPASGNKLEVNGKISSKNFQMGDNPGVGYYLVSSDASGNAAWQKPASIIAFSATNSGAGQIISVNTDTKILLSSESFDEGNGYNNGTSTFTVPTGEDGIYQFNLVVNFATDLPIGASNCILKFMVNGSNAQQVNVFTTTAGTNSGSSSALLKLKAGDTVAVNISVTGVSPSTLSLDSGASRISFSGFKLN